MAEAVIIPGPARIKVDFGLGFGLENLGYTINGARVSRRSYHQDVPGDERGGDAGPPIEIVAMGQTELISLEMSKWDTSVFAKVRALVPGGTDGTPPAAGTAMFQYGIRLLILPTTLPHNYPLVIFREAIELNLGAQYAVARITAEGHENASGILCNNSSS